MDSDEEGDKRYYGIISGREVGLLFYFFPSLITL
jgi:hypothetical protein